MFPFAESHPQSGEEAPPFMGERRPPQGQPPPSALAKLFPEMQIPELEPSWQPPPTSGGGGGGVAQKSWDAKQPPEGAPGTAPASPLGSSVSARGKCCW